MRVRRVSDGAGGFSLAREAWPEPLVPPLLREIGEAPYDVAAEYHRARHGVVAEQVRPLTLPEGVLERWSARLDGAAGE